MLASGAPPTRTRRRAALGCLGLVVLGAVGVMAMHRWPETPLPPLTTFEKALAAQLQADVTAMATTIGERNAVKQQALETCADWLARDFARDGYAVERQPFMVAKQRQENVIATKPGAKGREVVVVGAHYDTVMGAPGANDNGSGVAAMMAIMGLLSHRTFQRELRFVAFANEEYGFQTDQMGSRVYARRCRERGEHVTAMLSLETMGCFSHVPGSQRYPLPALGWVYPTRGNFVAIVGNLPSFGLAREVAARFRSHSDFPLQWTSLPEQVPGVAWSDHWSFWQEGFPAVMVTDTAPFRYVHYHTPADTPDKLDYGSFARVVEALVPVIDGLAVGT